MRHKRAVVTARTSRTHARTCATDSNAIPARKLLVMNNVVRFLMISPLAMRQWSLNLRVASGSDIKKIRKQSHPG